MSGGEGRGRGEGEEGGREGRFTVDTELKRTSRKLKGKKDR